MTKKILFFFLGVIFPCLIWSQGETSNWYFGDGAGIGFNNDGSVTPLTDGRLDTFEGCATISDAFGDLLFYTDGITVYDRNHNIMENGTGLYGDSSSTQSAIIVPKPKDAAIFYIFTVDTSSFENDPDRGLNYSVVDLSMNGGNGAVVQKNTGLLQDCSEKITAVIKDCFNESIWVITLSTSTGNRVTDFFDTYHAFEVNASGVITTSVKTTFNNLQIEDPRGYLKLSADGKKMVSANVASGLYIYDFDAETGMLSNQEQLTITSQNRNSYGIEFSPNRRYLYVHSFNDNPATNAQGHFSSLIQYDLQATSISDSQIVLDNSPIYRGALQLGENGKIYRTIAQSYLIGTPYLGVINSPDEPGTAADYRHNAIFLEGKKATQGLPPFVQSFFNKISLIKNNTGATENTLTICSGQKFVLEADFIPGASYIWEKDGIPVNNPGPIFQIDVAESIDSGRYRLEIVSADPSECPIIGESFISINPLPEANPLTLIQCDVDLNNPNDGITLFNLEQASYTTDYDFLFYESIPDRDAENPITDPVGYMNIQPFNQTIYYKVTNSSGCENFGELELQVQTAALSINPQNSLYVCDENPDDNLLKGTFDLETFGQDNYPNLEVSFYSSLEDATLEQNHLPNSYATKSITVYTRLESSNQCRGVEQLELIVNPSPIFDLENTFLWCTDGPSLKIIGPGGFDVYRWLKKEGNSEEEISTEQSASISMLGNYVLETGYAYTINGETVRCTNSSDFEVKPSNRATIQEIIVADISDNNTVQINVSGEGIYEFSLDGENYRDDALFDNVTPGFITVYIRDKNGCGITEELISVIGYPRFFTPNGDGINDSWQIIGVNSQFQAATFVTIYDRYGKLLAQISPESQGWNGTHNNQMVPASDYWFTVALEDGREFNGHFSLKR